MPKWLRPSQAHRHRADAHQREDVGHPQPGSVAGQFQAEAPPQERVSREQVSRERVSRQPERYEAGRYEAVSYESVHYEAGPSEAGRYEAARYEAGRSAAERGVAGRSDAGRGVAGRSAAGRGVAGRSEAGRSEAGRGEARRYQQARQASAAQAPSAGQAAPGQVSAGQAVAGQGATGQVPTGQQGGPDGARVAAGESADPAERRASILRSRRRMLGTLIALTLGAVVLGLTHFAETWIIIPPAVMLAGFLLLLREAARSDAERARGLAHAAEMSRAREAADFQRGAPPVTAETVVEDGHAAAEDGRRDAEADRAAEAVREAEAVAESSYGAQIIDFSARLTDQLYDQYTDAAERAIGD